MKQGVLVIVIIHNKVSNLPNEEWKKSVRRWKHSEEKFEDKEKDVERRIRIPVHKFQKR